MNIESLGEWWINMTIQWQFNSEVVILWYSMCINFLPWHVFWDVWYISYISYIGISIAEPCPASGDNPPGGCHLKRRKTRARRRWWLGWCGKVMPTYGYIWYIKCEWLGLWKNGTLSHFVPMKSATRYYQVVYLKALWNQASMVSWKPHRSLGICLAPAPFHKATKMGNAGASWKSLAWARSEVQGPQMFQRWRYQVHIFGTFWNQMHTHRYMIYIYIYIGHSSYIFVSTSHMCQKCGFSAQFDREKRFRGRRKKILMTPPRGNPGGQRSQ